MIMSAKIQFSLKKKFVEVPIEQEDGTIVVYEIRRASGEAIEAYLDENSDRIATNVSEEGKIQIKEIKTYKSMFVSLLKHCLYLKDELLDVGTIAKFPHDVQKGLFDIAQTVNGLSEEGAIAAKN
jgi:hypothetical protein